MPNIRVDRERKDRIQKVKSKVRADALMGEKPKN